MYKKTPAMTMQSGYMDLQDVYVCSKKTRNLVSTSAIGHREGLWARCRMWEGEIEEGIV